MYKFVTGLKSFTGWVTYFFHCCDKDTWQKHHKTWDVYFTSWFWGIWPVMAKKAIQVAKAKVCRFCLSYLFRLEIRSGLYSEMSTPFRTHPSSEACYLGPIPRGYTASWTAAAENQWPSTGIMIFHTQTLTQCGRGCVFNVLIIFALGTSLFWVKHHAYDSRGISPSLPQWQGVAAGNRSRKQRASELQMVWVSKPSKTTSSNILPLVRPHFPKQRQQLGSKRSNAWDYGGHFSVKSPQLRFKNTSR